jgi:FkbM family methyltransferase
MTRLTWVLSVALSRWRNRARYLLAAPRIYRNWWALPWPKLGVGVVLQLRNGLRYRVRPGTTDLAVINEASILNPYLASGHVQIRPDAIVVDIGANIGDFALQAAQLCSAGRVFAVEPVSEHVRMVEENVRLNGMGNVTCVRSAIGATDGTTEVRLRGNISSTRQGEGTAETVPVMTLERFLAEHGLERVDLLKMDCEGAEWDILPAAESVLPRVRQIAMEFHSAGVWTPVSLAAWLRERGYRVWHTAGPWNGLLWAVRA